VAARAVVFDVDGTLYHQAPLRREMARQLIIAHALHPLRGRRVMRALSAYRHAQEDLRHASGADLATQQLELASSNSGIPAPEVQMLVERWMEATPLGVLSRFARAGLRPSLERLRSNGARLAVLSDYPAEPKLRALGIHDLFDVVLCAQDPAVGVFKPHPRGIETAIERLGVSSADAVYVGDRPDVDAAAARAARVACVIIGSTPATTSDDFLTIADFEQLTAALGGPS
jgi:FMN phosphatase YigB (HAD superfamily)